MLEAHEKVSGLDRLPIFPLPLVMMPGEILPLHIFEDRYRQMLVDIEKERNLFGIIYFEPNEPLIDRPAAGAVGCVAEVRQVDALPDGRSNIVTYGLIRFRLNEYADTDRPYLVGEVEFFEDDIDDSPELEPLAEEVFVLFQRMASAAHKMSGSRSPLPELTRSDPESLSFLITAAFTFDNEKKYSLLESTSTMRRLSELKDVLDQAVGQIEESAEIQAVARTNGHSKKKLDI